MPSDAKQKPKKGAGPCPVRELLARIGDKWSVLAIVTLSQAPGSRCRFSELKKAVEGISQRMLTTTLRNLERDGMVKRYFYPEIPPRVEYELTPLGKSILAPMQELLKWIKNNWPKIRNSRESYDTDTRQKPKKQ